MKPFITISMPAKEMAKFGHWIESQTKETKDECRKIIETVIRHAEHKAKSLAPVNQRKGKGGRLRSSVHNNISSDGLGGMIYTAVKYAPYQDWGTGSRVHVPAFVKEKFGVDSMQWKGKGIRRVNIKPHPFFFVSANVAYLEMIHKLKALGFNETTGKRPTPVIFTNMI